MKKSKLKKILATGAMGIMALAMPFTLSGCNITEGSIKTDNEAYIMLREFADNFNIANQLSTHQSYISLGETTKCEYDFSESNLSDETIVFLQNNMDMVDSIDAYEGTKKYYFNSENNTGYKLEYNNSYDLIDKSETYSSLDLTRKTETNYISYRNKDIHYEDNVNSTFSKYQVNKDYAKTNYVYNEQNFYADSEAVYNFWSSILNHETFESYTANKNTIAENIISDVAKSEIDGNNLIVNIDIVYINNNYIFKVQVEGENIIIDEDAYSKAVINNLSAIVEIHFNNDGVINISSIMNATQNTEVGSLLFDMLESQNSNTNLDEDDKIKVKAYLDTHYSVNFDAILENAEYINNHLPIEIYCEDLSLGVSTPIKITLMDGTALIDEVYVYSNTGVNMSTISIFVPEKIGHTFVGFLDTNENPVSKNSVKYFTENTTLMLNYERNRYTVNFYLNGGELAEQQVSVLYGTTYNLSQVPTKEGFVFGGWFLNQDCTGDGFDVGSEIIIPHYNMNLYAKWIPISE